MTILLSGWKLWIVGLILAMALLGFINTVFIFVSTADEYAKYGARLTSEVVDKNGKILYAIDEHGRMWRPK
ncbi:MAG: hypothetical protein WC637_00175 [Victivallales bacterium]|jgi:hypothetical protein